MEHSIPSTAGGASATDNTPIHPRVGIEEGKPPALRVAFRLPTNELHLVEMAVSRPMGSIAQYFSELLGIDAQLLSFESDGMGLDTSGSVAEAGVQPEATIILSIRSTPPVPALTALSLSSNNPALADLHPQLSYSSPPHPLSSTSPPPRLPKRKLSLPFVDLGADLSDQHSLHTDGSEEDLFDGYFAGELLGHTAGVYRSIFSPDGLLIATASMDGTARLWSARSTECLAIFDPIDAGFIFSVFFSPDGRYLLVGGRNGNVWAWDVSKRVLLHRYIGHTGDVFDARISKDGTLAITASGDLTARVWDTRTQECKAILRGHRGYVFNAAFSDNMRLIATCGTDKSVMLWNAETYEPLYTFSENINGMVFSTVFSPDDKHIVASCFDGKVLLFNVDSKQLVRSFVGHTAAAFCPRFSPDGASLMTCSSDTTVRVWDVASGVCLRVLERHTDEVNCNACSPDGRMLVTTGAGSSGNCLLWYTPSEFAEGFAGVRSWVPEYDSKINWRREYQRNGYRLRPNPNHSVFDSH